MRSPPASDLSSISESASHVNCLLFVLALLRWLYCGFFAFIPFTKTQTSNSISTSNGSTRAWIEKVEDHSLCFLFYHCASLHEVLS